MTAEEVTAVVLGFNTLATVVCAAAFVATDGEKPSLLFLCLLNLAFAFWGVSNLVGV